MSDSNSYRLADTTLVEPLVNRWLAYSHVIAPVAASLQLNNYQLKLLESFLDDPRAHADACSDPKLRSGPFVDIAPERVDEVRKLVADTRERMALNLELAEDLFRFHNRLVAEAEGQSLDELYRQLPETLAGYVELVYDYYHRPSVRFFEALTYRSPYYDEGMQSLRLFRLERDDGRPYFMNTPRLPEDGALEWTLPFHRAEIDDLFRLDLDPRPLGEIRELLGLSAADDPRLLPLLDGGPAMEVGTWKGDDVRVRYVGHACALVEWKGVSMLTDPCVGARSVHGTVERISYRDLPRHIDFALVTHNHQDHFWPETLLRLRHRIGTLVVPRNGWLYGDLSLRLVAQALGFRNVVEVGELDSIPIPDGEIFAVPFMGEHADLAHGKVGYVIRAGRRQLLFGADSDCLDRRTWDHLRAVLGPIHTLFLGMECVGAPLTWDCGPYLPIEVKREHDQTRRYKGCDSARALEIVEAVDAEEIYVYAVGLEPWYEPILGLAHDESSKQIIETRELLRRAPELGIRDARLLFGKHDFHFDPRPEVREPAAAAAPEAEPVAAAFDDSGERFDFE
jgi:L-ascorbate metabolism protein UlaG (beta-lactamase superfamily)